MHCWPIRWQPALCLALIHNVWADLRSAFQSGRDARWGLAKPVPWRYVPGYLTAQAVGAFAGVAAAHLMFGVPVFSASRHVRLEPPRSLQRVRGAFGLLCVIQGCARSRLLPTCLSRSALTSPGPIGSRRRPPLRTPRLHSPARPAIRSPESGLQTHRASSWPQLAEAAAATLLFRCLAPALPSARRVYESGTQC